MLAGEVALCSCDRTELQTTSVQGKQIVCTQTGRVVGKQTSKGITSARQLGSFTYHVLSVSLMFQIVVWLHAHSTRKQF